MAPDCKRAEKTRGLCGPHYNQVRKMVAGGVVTWEELEKAGKIRPKNSESRKFKDWILKKQ